MHFDVVKAVKGKRSVDRITDRFEGKNGLNIHLWRYPRHFCVVLTSSLASFLNLSINKKGGGLPPSRLRSYGAKCSQADLCYNYFPVSYDAIIVK